MKEMFSRVLHGLFLQIEQSLLAEPGKHMWKKIEEIIFL